MNSSRKSVPIVIIFAVLSLATCVAVADEEKSRVETIVHPGIWGLDFSPDGKWLAAATNLKDHGGPIIVWSTADWSQHLVRPEGKGGLHVSFSPNGENLAYSTRGNTVTVVDVKSTEVVYEIEAHQDSVFCVEFAPDGNSLITSSLDNSIKIWDAMTGKLVRTIQGDGAKDGKMYAVAVSPDGTMLLGGEKNIARLWEFETGMPTKRFRERGSIVRRVGFSRDGKFFFVCSWDGKTRLHAAQDHRIMLMVKGGSDCADMSPGNRYMATVGWNNIAHVFQIDLNPPTPEQTDQVRQLIRKFKSDDYRVRETASMEIAKIGLLAEPFLHKSMKSSDAEVRLRSRRLRRIVRSPEPEFVLAGHAGDVEYVKFSDDGKLLATACRGGDIKIWSVPGFKELRTLHAPNGPAEK